LRASRTAQEPARTRSGERSREKQDDRNRSETAALSARSAGPFSRDRQNGPAQDAEVAPAVEEVREIGHDPSIVVQSSGGSLAVWPHSRKVSSTHGAILTLATAPPSIDSPVNAEGDPERMSRVVRHYGA